MNYLLRHARRWAETRLTMTKASGSQAHRACPVVLPLSLFLFLLIAQLPVRAEAQSIAGEPGAGIPESGSLSLANALAAVALDPSTGVLTSSLPIESPAARGVPQPGLALTYNSAAGIREAGVGWGLNVPSIERQNRDGAPQYRDPSDVFIDYAAILVMDRFVYNGKPLVPICQVKPS